MTNHALHWFYRIQVWPNAQVYSVVIVVCAGDIDERKRQITRKSRR